MSTALYHPWCDSWKSNLGASLLLRIPWYGWIQRETKRKSHFFSEPMCVRQVGLSLEIWSQPAVFVQQSVGFKHSEMTGPLTHWSPRKKKNCVKNSGHTHLEMALLSEGKVYMGSRIAFDLEGGVLCASLFG